MLVSVVVCSVLCLLISCAALFVVGHRIGRGHWLLSLATAASVGFASWLLQHSLTDSGLALDATLTVAVVATAVVAAAFERWNPLGHACFASACVATVAYLGYAAFVLAVAHLGPWSMAFGILLFVLQFAAMGLLLVHTFEIIRRDVPYQLGTRRGSEARL
jgi:hypothetical protein